MLRQDLTLDMPAMPQGASLLAESDRIAQERHDRYFSDASLSRALQELFPEMTEDAKLQEAIFQVYCKDGPHHREIVPWFRLDPKDPICFL